MYSESDERYRKKIKAAYLIYRENLSQQEAAKLLCISRPTLAKYLDEMQQEGIVTIKLSDPRNYFQLEDLGFSLKKKFNLKDTLIVDAQASDSPEIIDNIGITGANYLRDHLCSGMKIGLTGGRTINAVISHLQPVPQFSDIEVVATTGGSLYANTKYYSNTLVQQLAELLHGTSHFIFAPTYADNKEQHDVLIQNSQIRSSIAFCKTVDIVLTGIGDQNSALDYLPTSIAELIRHSPMDNLAGAINTLLLDKNGNPYISPAAELFIGLDYLALKQIESVFLLAGGRNKHNAIKAALLGGYANILITDKYTAEYLLE